MTTDCSQVLLSRDTLSPGLDSDSKCVSPLWLQTKPFSKWEHVWIDLKAGVCFAEKTWTIVSSAWAEKRKGKTKMTVTVSEPTYLRLPILARRRFICRRKKALLYTHWLIFLVLFNDIIVVEHWKYSHSTGCFSNICKCCLLVRAFMKPNDFIIILRWLCPPQSMYARIQNIKLLTDKTGLHM